MKLPSTNDLFANLRAVLVAKAEDLYLTIGGSRGSEIVEKYTGVPGVDCLPSDWFSHSVEIDRIKLEGLAITVHVEEIRKVLATGSMGWQVEDGSIDCDALEQDHLGFLEVFLTGVPTVALGGWDWSYAASSGALMDLMKLGKAWHHLVTAIDTGTDGDFDDEPITPTDLALIAGIDIRTMRNLIGPSKPIRTIEQQVVPEAGRLANRTFAVVDRFDALEWLQQRKSFHIARTNIGILSNRIMGIQDEADATKAAVLAALLLGKTRDDLANSLDIDVKSIRGWSECGLSPLEGKRLVDYVINLDNARSSDTAPAMPEG